MYDRVYEWTATLGLGDNINQLISYGVMLVITLILSGIARFVARHVLDNYAHKISERTPTKIDDLMIEYRVLHALSWIAPAIVIYNMAHLYRGVDALIRDLAISGIVIFITIAIFRGLDALVEVVRKRNALHGGPLKGIIQVVKIALVILSGLIVIVTFMGNDVAWAIFSSIGGLSAVLLLIFRDSILGLVAGLQLSSGGILKLGDWLQMDKYGADGEVVDISLNKITVRNWDKTYTSIPAYRFLEDSFKNWEGMTESGGRRIKRSILIDLNTIDFLRDEQIEELRQIDILKPYLDGKEEVIDEHNKKAMGNHPANRRQLTNVGTFRAYIETYLKNSDKIHQGLTLLVRQLAPSEKGLPIEIYCFSKDINWAVYEGIQSDLFDHMYAIMPSFGLRPYQQPGGEDIRGVAAAIKRGM